MKKTWNKFIFKKGANRNDAEYGSGEHAICLYLEQIFIINISSGQTTTNKLDLSNFAYHQ